MTPTQIATIATLILQLGLVLARRAKRDASPEEREKVDAELREVVREAEAELEAHPGERG